MIPSGYEPLSYRFCSTVRQPTAPPRTPEEEYYFPKIKKMYIQSDIESSKNRETCAEWSRIDVDD